MEKVLKTGLNVRRALCEGGRRKRRIELRKERVSELRHDSVVSGISAFKEKKGLLLRFRHCCVRSRVLFRVFE